MRTKPSLPTAVLKLALLGLMLPAITSAIFAADATVQGELLTKYGTVEFNGTQTNWVPAEVGLKLVVEDRLRTLALSGATLRLAELGRLRVDELTTLEILPPQAATSKATLDLKAGAFYFFTRDKPREFLIQTPYAIGASRGTEFLTEVEPSGRTILTVFDGEVELTNAQGSIVLTNGEQGTVQAGQAPVKTPVIQAKKVVQWWLYYPGVLDPDELGLTVAEQTALAASLTAYKAGDLKQALNVYPTGRVPQSEAERIYQAGLLLSVGQVDRAEAILATVSAQSPLAIALREVIATVSSGGLPDDPPPTLATEWLALSYVQQATNLEAALRSANSAARKSPAFGFAWERVAELEFSLGHREAAKSALAKALQFSPRNAQALALQGFILSAENRFGAASEYFERAIQTDGALGNAWLGRGLCRIHSGDDLGGRSDLQTAAALEPNRSLLRSYLGKAFSNVYDERHADRELALARRLDPNDPTPPLYSALLDEQENRQNQGVENLEQSLGLNDNRRVYLWQLLMVEDRAVRSSSLATIYDKTGMEQVAAREAARAVNDDYGNYSAHLFLANSLDSLRDPTLYNLRYDTPWLNELLLANLLAPAGAGALSQNITQQEYSKLFEADGPGVATDSSWRSDGQYNQTASQFGNYGNTSYSVDFQYRHNDGVRPNQELDIYAGTFTLKQQLTPQDSVLLPAAGEDNHSGDNAQYYDQTQARTNLTYNQQLTPTILVGYHREWSPGVHTLFLGTRLSANQQLSDQNEQVPILFPGIFNGGTNLLTADSFNVNYGNELTIYGAELNQIFQGERNTLVAGARFQTGQFQGQDLLTPVFNQVYSTNHATTGDFQRIAGYVYDTVELTKNLQLIGGLAYDTVNYPENFQNWPVSAGSDSRHNLGPKAGIIWSPIPEATVRGAYAKSIGGVSLDQSFRLEPVQIAGFDQSFRNIMPVNAAGDVAAPSFELYGIALDLKFKSRTYIGIQAQLLKSDGGRGIGFYPVTNTIPYPAATTVQEFSYKEQSLSVTLNQLVGEDWSLGAQYLYTRSELNDSFPQIPPPTAFVAFPENAVRASLQQVTPYLVFNHRSGLFARVEAPWYSQDNSGYNPALPGDAFYQVNLYAGYRFPHQHGDFTLGLLNLNAQDYQLNPLSLYSELPRTRVWSLRLRLSF